MMHVAWQQLLDLLSWYPTCLANLLQCIQRLVTQISSTGSHLQIGQLLSHWSYVFLALTHRNELQWLDLKIGYWESSPIFSLEGDMKHWWPYLLRSYAPTSLSNYRGPCAYISLPCKSAGICWDPGQWTYVTNETQWRKMGHSYPKAVQKIWEVILSPTPCDLQWKMRVVMTPNLSSMVKAVAPFTNMFNFDPSMDM